MPTIATTTYPAEAYVRVDVDWSDYPDVEYARVIRINTATGEEVTLRPYVAFNADGDLMLLCSQGIWWDTDPPLGVPLQYRTEAADVPTNATANPSFESGTAPWTVAGGTLAQSAVFAHAGAFSGLLTPTGGTTFANTVTQTGIAVTAQVPATVSGWALTPQGWGAIRLQVSWFNSMGGAVGSPSASDIEILDDLEWRYLELTATPPVGAVTASMTVQASGFAPNTTLFYLDQLELAQPVPQTAYALSALVTVTATFPYYLKDPIFPCHDVGMLRCVAGPHVCSTERGIMVLTGTGERESYAPNSVVLRPVDAALPILQRRQRREAETTINLITRLFEDREALKRLLRPETILFFQGPANQGHEDRYYIAGAYTIDAPLRDKRIQPRLFAIPVEQGRRPDEPMHGPCGIRVDDLCDLYGSWAAMTIAGITWGGLLVGDASFASPGVDTSAWRTFDDVEAEFADFDAVNTGGRTFTGLLTGL